MRFVKICGLQSCEEAQLARECGATAFGFLVGLTHLAEDKLTPSTARAIVRTLPSGCNTVLVTHLLDVSAIADLAREIGVRTIQVHGDVPVEGIRKLRSSAPQFDIVKAVHVTGPQSVAMARKFAASVHGLVLDSRTADRLGGTGKTHDWTVSRRIVAAVSPTPVYLAGGLTPDNVEKAIELVLPAGVDVNSGVEDASGRKDKEKLKSFISRAAKALDAVHG
jgi:phosphoribosylanthranilate isomerase